MFVNEQFTDKETGRTEGRTIDRDRGLELKEITASYDEILLVLNGSGSDIVISADYRFSGSGGSTIEYFIRNIGRYLPPKYKAYKFSSREEKLKIAAFIEEALTAFGLHYCFSPGRSVKVSFSDHALSFVEEKQWSHSRGHAGRCVRSK